MITELTVEGLKGVGRVELRFQPGQRVHTLFGPNGAGKTKCLEALYTFLLFGNQAFLHERRNAIMPSDFAVMRWATSEFGPVFQSSLEQSHITAAQVWATASGALNHELPILFLGAQNRSVLNGGTHAGPIQSVPLLGAFEDRRKKYLSKLAAALIDMRLGSLGMVEDVQSWFVARAQSNNPYQRGTDNRKVEIDAVLEMLNAIDDRIAADFLEIDGTGSASLKVEGQTRRLGDLSSGFTSLVKLVQSIIAGYANFTNETNLRHVRGVVLIDEIESHLHPQWQTTIVKKLKTMLPNTTFYMATHSPLVLSQLEEDEAYLLERKEDGVVRTEKIEHPNRRILIDVLQSAFGVDLNRLKKESLGDADQTAAKKALLDLLADDDQEGHDA